MIASTPRPTRRRRPTPIIRLILLIGLALIVATTGVACSDAPTEIEIERADDGVDPSIVIVMITKDLEPVMEQLGETFAETRRGATFRYVVEEPDELAARIDSGYRPSLWVDNAAAIGPHASDPTAQGAPAPFGEAIMTMVVHDELPREPRPTLAAFGGESVIASGICGPTFACGVGARLVLDDADIVADPVLDDATPAEIIEGLQTRTIDAALVYRPEAARLGSFINIVPVPDPSIGRLEYQSIVFGRSPFASEFQRWLGSAPEATEILIRYGWRNQTPSGGT